MFAISKLVNALLSPFIWILLLSLFVFALKQGKKKKWMIFFWVLTVYLFTTYAVVNPLIARYEMPYKPIEKGKTYACAVVLSGASSFDQFSASLQLNQAAERLTEPVILYKKGIVKKLLITGGSASVFPPYEKEAVYVRRFWLDLGVPDSAIWVESESRNTVENAQFSRKLLERNGLGREKVLLITSALHAPRSSYIFNRQNVAFDIYPVDFIIQRKTKRTFKILDHLIPKTGAIENWELLIHEWVGMLSARF